MFLDREHIDGSQRFELLTQHLGLFAERGILELHRRQCVEHLFERSTPFGLESLANGRASARQFGESHLGAMQLVAHRARVAPNLV